MTHVPITTPASPLITADAAAGHHDAEDAAHAHSPHLAHHFDSPAQQYSSAKLGMWVFLGTELLMFGGLFCAYSVYRFNHPEVFSFAHRALNPLLGGINTAVLIASSLTMAMAVRYAQLGKTLALAICLSVTILGGAGFMVIKTVEYHTKFEHDLFPGRFNVYNSEYEGKDKQYEDLAAIEHEGAAEHDAGTPADAETMAKHNQAAVIAGAFTNQGAEHPKGIAPEPAHAAAMEASEGSVATPATAVSTTNPSMYANPLKGTSDEPKIWANFAEIDGLAETQQAHANAHSHLTRSQLTALDQHRINTFFSIYFMMTGLHGVHVLVGMALIYWVLVRSVPTGHKKWVVPLGPLVITLLLGATGSIVHSDALLAFGVIASGVLAIAMAALFVITHRPGAAPAGPAEFGPEYFTPVDLVGLYWHLVDLIWIFLFPLLYLIH